MSPEHNPGNSLERNSWRVIGVGTAIEAIKLLATLPFPKTESQAMKMMGISLLIPFWVLWGEKRGGWFWEDISKIFNSLRKKAK